MALALNHVIVAGNLTADVELKQTTSGVYVSRFSLAVHRKRAKQGEDQKTDFFKIVAWRHSAEFLSRYASKGDNVVVSGMLQTESWTDSQGNKRTEVVIIADEVELNKNKASSASEGQNEQSPEDDDLPF